MAEHRLGDPRGGRRGSGRGAGVAGRRGQVRARWYHDLSAEDVKALGRPAMDYAREQLRGRLAGWLNEQCLRWLHPTSGRRPGEPLL